MSQINPFLPSLLFGHEFFVTAVETLRLFCTSTLGCCCDRTDSVLERIVERLWNVGLEEPLSVKRSVGCSVEVGR